MNSPISILRAAFVLVGAMTLAAALPSTAVAQQQGVSVNGTTLCNDAPNLTLTPAGLLTVTCTPISNGGNPTAPICSSTTMTVTADPSANQTIAMSCSSGGSPITSYAWAASAGAPFPAQSPTTASFSTGPFPTAGTTYTYYPAATNSVGTSSLATITVNVVAQGSCTTTAVTGTWASTIYDTATPVILKNSYVSYKLPIWTTANKVQYFSAVNNGAGSGNDPIHPLITQFAVSTCPGDFNVPAACQVFGDPMNAAIKLTTRSVSTPSAVGCALNTGTQYYFNVRNVDSNLVNSCQSSNCSEILRLNGN